MLKSFAKAVAASALILALAAPLAAAKRDFAVVELFTSQGCSSCPPADRLLNQLARRENVIALSFPVSYWDYLGWKDTLASPENNQRQRDYAEKQGHGKVYTPQIIINGLEQCVGNDMAKIEAEIRDSAKTLRDARVELTVERKDGNLHVRAGDAPQGSPYHSGRLIALAVAHAIEVPIKRGENEGATITYSNVVRNISEAGQWRGAAAAYDLPLASVMRKDADFIVLLLQDEDTGAILGAAQTRDIGEPA
jgi:hypothetical protein